MFKFLQKYNLLPPIYVSIVFLVSMLLAFFILLQFFSFQNPFFLLISLVSPFIIFLYFYNSNNANVHLPFNSNKTVGTKNNVIEYIAHTPFFLYLMGLGVLLFALARPQLDEENWETTSQEAIDIVISTDISGSMLAEDFKPNRLEAARNVAIEFIKKKKHDRIGLVIYEGEAFLQCPVTTDYSTLISLFKKAKTGLLKGGTAIGSGLVTAIQALRKSESKSKVVILLTDGVNQAQQQISPLTAAEIAKSLGVRVYTIGVGTNGKAKTPVAIKPDGSYVYDYVDVRIDEELLKSISKKTNGKYFRATEKKALENIYKEIDALEKTKLTITKHSSIPERFYPFIITGFFIILLGFILDKTVLKKL